MGPQLPLVDQPMKIDAVPLAAALDRARRLNPQVLRSKPPLDYVPTQDRTQDQSRLLTRASFLSRGGAHASELELERLMGTNDLVDEFLLERALVAAAPVCRISIRAPGGADGLYVLKNGKKVKDLRDLDDSDVDWIANAGIRVSRLCARLQAERDRGSHLSRPSRAG